MRKMSCSPYRLCLFFLAIVGENVTEGKKLYVSVAYGNDSWPCDQSRPCQTVGLAIALASGGDEIYLDGTGTDKHPYTCDSQTSEYPGIYINKSLSLIGYGSPMPQVRCSEGKGWMFNGSDNADQMNVALTFLLVNRSVMTFQDSSAEIDGCKFEGNKEGLKFVISNEKVSRVQITNSSFSKNRQCTSVIVNVTKNTKTDHQVIFLVNETSFIDNVLSDEESCMSFTKSSYTDELPILNVTLDSVTFSRNKFGASGIILFKTDQNGILNINLQNVTFMDNSPSSFGDAVTGEGHNECIIQSNTVNLFLNESRFTSKNSRLLNVSASNISLHIYNSNFSGHNVKGKGGVVFLKGQDYCKVIARGSSFVNTTAVQGGAINIKCFNLQRINFQDSVFLRNTATNGKGGAVYIDSQDCNSTEYSTTSGPDLEEGANLPPTISINKCVFNNSFSSSGAVAICALQVSVELHHSVFTNCTANCTTEIESKNHAGGGVLIQTRLFLLLTVETCHFERCTSNGTFSGSLAVSYEGVVDITVHNSLFAANEGGALLINSPSVFPDGNFSKAKKSQVTIENTHFLNNTSTNNMINSAYYSVVWLFVCNYSIVSIENVTMESNRADRDRNTVFVAFNSTLKVYQSRFFRNIAHSCGGAIFTLGLKEVQVRDSIFDGNYAGAGGALCIRFGLSEYNQTTDLVVNIFNTTFRNCSASSSGGALVVFLSGNLDLKVQSTRFLDNLAFPESGGAVSVVILKPGQKPPWGEEYVRNNYFAERLPSWDYYGSLTFEDTTFESNAATFGGALHLTYGKAVFRNCSFVDNFAITQGGHIYASAGSVSLNILESFFLQTMKERPIGTYLNASKVSFIHSQSSGDLTVHNTTFNATAYGISSSIMQVTNAGQINLRPNKLTAFFCPVGSMMTILKFEEEVSRLKLQLILLDFICSPCPVNFYSLQHGQALGLQLVDGFKCFPCPFGANCSQNIVAKPGFWGFEEPKNSLALHFILCPLDYCRPPQRMRNFGKYNGCQGNRTGYLCGRCNVNFTETLYSTHCIPSHECNGYLFWPVALVYISVMALLFTFQPPVVPWIKRHIFWFKHHEPENPHDNLFCKGYLKILFYFYQASNLLLMSTSAQHVIGTKFIEPLIGFFSFQQKLSSNGLTCPFPGLTVVTKHLFSAFQVFGTLLMIGTIYILDWGVQKLRGRGAPSVGPYVGGVLQAMLLGYTTLASVSFSLLRCVSIGSEQRLFLDGNVVCFCWWQYFLIVLILSFFVPFVFVLLWGSLKMYNRFLSVGEFLLACCFPLPLLLFWACTSLFRAAQNEVLEASPRSELSRNSVERVLYDSFKRPGNSSSLSLCWESVMIGRRLILIVFNVFVSDPMLRLLIMILFCVLFLLHHAFAQPFRDGIVNILETISLMSIVVLAAINLFFASFVSLAVPLNDHFTYWWKACQVVETIILCAVPALFGVLVVAAVLSQVCRLTVAVYRFLYLVYVVCSSWCCRKEVEGKSPLL